MMRWVTSVSVFARPADVAASGPAPQTFQVYARDLDPARADAVAELVSGPERGDGRGAGKGVFAVHDGAERLLRRRRCRQRFIPGRLLRRLLRHRASLNAQKVGPDAHDRAAWKSDALPFTPGSRYDGVPQTVPGQPASPASVQAVAAAPAETAGQARRLRRRGRRSSPRLMPRWTRSPRPRRTPSRRGSPPAVTSSSAAARTPRPSATPSTPACSPQASARH